MAYSVTVEPSKKVDLSKIDTAADGGLSKSEGVKRTEELTDRLADLQQELYAASVHPQGCQVTSFKAPNDVELEHDYLWRIHRRTPAKGTIGVFNRSHYEDVLIVRVHDLVPPKVWKQRYRQINDFERLLAANDTIVCKFFLHISHKEQEERLLAREQDVEKAYKLSPDDWKERRRWDAYMAAYQDALERCNTAEAPWTVVPADRKWYRNLAIAESLVDRLEGHRKTWSARLKELSEQRLEELAEIRERDAAEQAGG
jgi:PPK2 family polyphosphate:nucleotide phosphotransferase